MPEFIDLTGECFGMWTVIKRGEDKISPKGAHFTTWLCKCDCGTERAVLRSSLMNGRSKSCGCNLDGQRKKCGDLSRTHGETRTRLYQIWAGIKKRCYNPNAKNFHLYGGRGIKMCTEWLNNYEAFRDWALEHGYNDDLSIDRIDVNGGYSPENCRWTTSVVQNNNRRGNVRITYNDKNHTIAEWSKILNIPYKRLHKWIHKGKTIEEIISA